MREMIWDVFATMRTNVRRTLLSGVATVWGIFIFILLMGFSQSLVRGAGSNQNYMDQNMIWLTPSITSKPYQGNMKERKITLNEEDMNYVASQFPQKISAIYPVIEKSVLCSYQEQTFFTSINGVRTGFMTSMYVQLVYGRDLEEFDEVKQKKVCLLPIDVASQLFDHNPQTALDKEVLLNDIPFKVVGIYESVKPFILRDNIYIPLSTSIALYKTNGEYDRVSVFLEGLNTYELNVQFKSEIYKVLAQRKHFDPTDLSAISLSEEFSFRLLMKKFLRVFQGICTFIGILSLALGIIGISSVMFISVKDRTYELALRRILGASDFSIMFLVLTESTIIMLISGYIGIAIGSGFLKFASTFLFKFINTNPYMVMFGDTTLSMSIILMATAILVIGGIIAGWAPARYALRMKLIGILNS